jgi:hypothetical protein
MLKYTFGITKSGKKDGLVLFFIGSGKTLLEQERIGIGYFGN